MLVRDYRIAVIQICYYSSVSNIVEAPNFVRGYEFNEMDKTLRKQENNYVLARALELSSLLSFLLANGWLKQENLEGPIIDLGTGNGVGLLALRQFTLAYLLGVDQLSRSRYNGYSGSSVVSTEEIMEASLSSFRQADVLDFLRRWPYQSASLVTAFYATPMNPKIVDEIGKVLPPNGQFLFTSDQHDVATPTWGDQTVHLEGKGGVNSSTLVLPVPQWVRERYAPRIENAINNDPERQRIVYLLEPEFFDSSGSSIGLIRDRTVKVFTKHPWLKS